MPLPDSPTEQRPIPTETEARCTPIGDSALTEMQEIETASRQARKNTALITAVVAVASKQGGGCECEAKAKKQDEQMNRWTDERMKNGGSQERFTSKAPFLIQILARIFIRRAESASIISKILSNGWAFAAFQSWKRCSNIVII
jgi:hypothetical protein